MHSTPPTAQWLENWFEEHQSSLLNDFATFLQFKSISTEVAHVEDMKACADWLAAYVEAMGFTTELWPTATHPVLFAEYTAEDPNAPTVLIYNHYDVQPIDPIELWQSPPFEATQREGEIYARGAQDNKGQCFYVLAAIKALLQRDGALPVHLKLCIEGEEEAGSAGLHTLLEERRAQLSADHFLVVDMGVHSLDRPAITLGIRGAAMCSITVEGSNTDLHSGLYGGVAINPLHVLVDILAKARAEDGSITVPGFYDDVLEISPEEVATLDLEFEEEGYRAQTGHLPRGGESEYSPLESAWLRPTLEINGIGGGYFGQGFKTVIPAKAVAKVSCRLVRDQKPETIAQLLKHFVQEHVPEGCTVHIEVAHGGGPAVRTSTNNPSILATSRAIAEVFDQPCRYIMSGGSIPVIAEMSAVVGVEPVLLGLGLPEDNMHAPNEHFGINRLKKGTAVIGRTLELLKSVPPS